MAMLVHVVASAAVYEGLMYLRYVKVQLQHETVFRGYGFFWLRFVLQWSVFSRRKQSDNAAAARKVGAMEP